MRSIEIQASTEAYNYMLDAIKSYVNDYLTEIKEGHDYVDFSSEVRDYLNDTMGRDVDNYLNNGVEQDTYNETLSNILDPAIKEIKNKFLGEDYD